MRLLRHTLKLIVLLALIGLAVALYYVANPNLPSFDPPKELHYLQQWNDEQRQTYYYTPRAPRLRACATTGLQRWRCPSARRSSPASTTSPVLAS